MNRPDQSVSLESIDEFWFQHRQQRHHHHQQQQRQQQQQTTQAPSMPLPPPPYTPSESEAEDDEESDADSECDEPSPSPLRLTINAATSVQGCNNLIPLSSPSALADSARFSALLLAAVNQINNAAAAAQPQQRRRGLKVDLTINCGTTVIGDRNVVGSVGLRPRQGSFGQRMATNVGTPLSPPAVVGAKRKPEDGADVDDGREAKRVAHVV